MALMEWLGISCPPYLSCRRSPGAMCFAHLPGPPLGAGIGCLWHNAFDGYAPGQGSNYKHYSSVKTAIGQNNLQLQTKYNGQQAVRQDCQKFIDRGSRYSSGKWFAQHREIPPPVAIPAVTVLKLYSARSQQSLIIPDSKRYLANGPTTPGDH